MSGGGKTTIRPQSRFHFSSSSWPLIIQRSKSAKFVGRKEQHINPSLLVHVLVELLVHLQYNRHLKIMLTDLYIISNVADPGYFILDPGYGFLPSGVTNPGSLIPVQQQERKERKN
jgi:hypothetical protein